jgi:hypothetical protein
MSTRDPGTPTIEILVDPEGITRVQTRGFAGASCREASRFVEEALGRRSAEHLTADFYRQATTDRQLRQST